MVNVKFKSPHCVKSIAYPKGKVVDVPEEDLKAVDKADYELAGKAPEEPKAKDKAPEAPEENKAVKKAEKK